jgi:hypothetical protein
MASFQNAICGLPQESHSQEIFNYTMGTFLIAWLFVTLRLIGKYCTSRIGFDDYTLLSSFLLAIFPVACVFKSMSCLDQILSSTDR